MLVISLDKYILILLCPTIILFLMIPSEYSLPTNILTKIAIKSPINDINPSIVFSNAISVYSAERKVLNRPYYSCAYK